MDMHEKAVNNTMFTKTVLNIIKYVLTTNLLETKIKIDFSYKIIYHIM